MALHDVEFDKAHPCDALDAAHKILRDAGLGMKLSKLAASASSSWPYGAGTCFKRRHLATGVDWQSPPGR